MKIMLKLCLLMVLVVSITGCGAVINSPFAGNFPPPPPVQIENLNTHLTPIQQLIDQGDTKTALKMVDEWIKQNPDSEVTDQALFLKAQAYFDNNSYHNASYAYEDLLNGYSTSTLYETSLRQEMEIARLYLTGKKRILWDFLPIKAHSDAIVILDGIFERWPLSPLAAQALMMQADYFSQNGRFLEAESTYQLLVDHYRNSQFFEAALLGSAQASQAQFQGPNYDSRCLTNARFKYERYRAMFPENAQKFGVAERINRIDWQEGEKCFLIGDYYRRTKRMGAARYYLEYIIQRWPGGEWALKAENLIRQTENEMESSELDLPNTEYL
ncbi:MAG: tetratricopeptide repeat protein [Planctomycetes bacterium]|nr:tetratricopeptide repeat protein [Planctomycetota bacterium]